MALHAHAALDGHIHADDPPCEVEERAAAVAEIDGCVGLYMGDSEVESEGGYDAPRRREAIGVERIAERQHFVALSHARCDLKDGQASVDGDLQDGDVLAGVGRGDLSGESGAVVEYDGRAVGSGDDVVIGQDVPCLVDDESRSPSGRSDDAHHAGSLRLDDVCDG